LGHIHPQCTQQLQDIKTVLQDVLNSTVEERKMHASQTMLNLYSMLKIRKDLNMDTATAIAAIQNEQNALVALQGQK